MAQVNPEKYKTPQQIAREYARQDAELTFRMYQALEQQRQRRRSIGLWLVVLLALAAFFLMGCTTEPARQYGRDLGDSRRCLERPGARPGYCSDSQGRL